MSGKRSIDSALAISSTSNAVVSSATTKRVKQSSPPPDVLEEDAYTAQLENIIRRDFFPEYHQYKLRQAEARSMGLNTTPAALSATPTSIFEERSRNTPALGGIASTPLPFPRNDQDEPTAANPDDGLTQLTLTQFLQRYTSEDNAAFEVLMEKTRAEHRRKYWWSFSAPESRRLTVSDLPENPLLIKEHAEDGRLAAPKLWAYEPKNAVMYVPSGEEVEQNAAAKLSLAPEKQVKHANTRFPAGFLDALSSSSSASATPEFPSFSEENGPPAAATPSRSTPLVNGHKLVRTPSPAPGAGGQSPFITWGDVVGTPLHLDAEDAVDLSMDTSKPSFKVPKPPSRDEIARKLSKKATSDLRKRSSTTSPSPLLASSTHARVSSPMTPGATSHRYHMSPAARKLLSSPSSRLHADMQLRQSYTSLGVSHTPSPQLNQHRSPTISRGAATPSSAGPSVVASPNTSRSRRSAGESNVNVHTRNSVPLSHANHSATRLSSSLTDGLLKL